MFELGRLNEAWDALHSGITIHDQMKASNTLWYFMSKMDLVRLAKERGDPDSAHRLSREALSCAESLDLDQHPDPGVQDSLRELHSLLAAL